jgi:UDP:flavonoid glycosyltransferase YjiC (YdhE family)
MARFVFAWELGTGYAHVAGFLPVAERLRARGHQVELLLRDLTHADQLLGARDLRFFQAPVDLSPATGPSPPLSYPEILASCGFARIAPLVGRLRAWRSLYDLLQPDLLILDHAPTALAAARGRVPCALFGEGFFSPPRISPMPQIRFDIAAPATRIEESERQVLDNLNRATGALGGPSLERLADLFDLREDFLCTFAELDPYPERGDARYQGPRFLPDQGDPPPWPDAGGPRLFLYLHATYAYLDELLSQLRRLSCGLLVHVLNAPPGLVRRHQAPNLHIAVRPLNLQQVARECDAAITHGSHGTSACVLLAGRPLLLLPMYTEQMLTARRIADAGAGIAAPGGRRPPPFRTLVKQLLADRKLHSAAAAFAARYAAFDPVARDRAIVQRCEQLAAVSRGPEA